MAISIMKSLPMRSCRIAKPNRVPSSAGIGLGSMTPRPKISVSAPLLPGATHTDAKIDVCGHCTGHTLAQWDDIIQRTMPCHEPPELSSLGDGVRVAFAGLGVTAAGRRRLNVYLRAAR